MERDCPVERLVLGNEATADGHDEEVEDCGGIEELVSLAVAGPEEDGLPQDCAAVDGGRLEVAATAEL